MILTVGTFTFSTDERFHALHDEGSEEWVLKIQNPTPSDSGIYDCQVNTEPKISLTFNLKVIGRFDIPNKNDKCGKTQII